MCFFIGNDFVHNSPCINIRYNGLNNLLDIYNNLQEENGGMFYLIYDKKLHLDNFKKFINKLSLKENEYLEKILFIRDKQHKKIQKYVSRYISIIY